MPIDRDGDGPPLRRQDAHSGAGERGGDLRATPFTDDVFTDDYYGRRKSRASGSRSLSVIVGVVLGVAIAAGAGWYLLRGSGINSAMDEHGIVKADATPYKVRPNEPGGMQVENQDKLVYDRVAKGSAPARVENLLPPAEEPKAPPRKPKVEPPVEAAPAPKVEAPVAEAPKPAPEPVKEPVKEAAKEVPKPAAPQVDPLAAAVAAAAPGRTAATGPISILPQTTLGPEAAKPAASQPAAQVAAVPTPAITAPAPTPAGVSGPAYQIQLASVLSEDAAMAEWKRISGKNKEILGSYAPAVTKADLGERGVFYRLRAGPLADKAAADALCASLAAQNVGCIVVKP